MFYKCFSLKAIPELDISNVTDMSDMFNYCQELKSIPLFDTSNVKIMNSMFAYCQSLKTIPQLNMKSATSVSSIFNTCYLLLNLNITNIYKSLKINSTVLLSYDTLINLLNNLMPVETTQTLTLGTTNLAKLTDEDKMIATNKGWSLA
jgi:surface protein